MDKKKLKPINSPSRLFKAVKEGRTIYTEKWGDKPAAFIAHLPFTIIMREFKSKSLFIVKE